MILSGIFSRAGNDELGTLENPSKDLYAALGADEGGTASGMSVSESKAESLSALYCGVRVISEMGSSGPINVYERDEQASALARDHAAHDLLENPNKYQTGMSLRESLLWCANVWGGGFAEIERRNSGQAVAMHFLHSSKVSINHDALRENELVWTVSESGARPREIPDADMFHLKGPGEGLRGKPVVRILRETIGRALAVRDHGAQWFKNGGRLQAILKHPGDLKEDKIKQILSSFQKAWSGGRDGSQRIGILTNQLEFANSLATNNEDAQFLETEYFGVEEVCRVLNIPPHIVKHLARATNNNIEHQGLEFYTITMLPWFRRFEEEAERKLLTASEQGSYFIRHNADFILRGDFKSRMEGHAVAVNWGIKTRDEVRKLEDIGPLPDGMGEIPLVPKTHMAAQVVKVQSENPVPEPVPNVEPQEPTTGNGEPEDEPQPDDNRTADPPRLRSMLADIIQGAVSRLARLEADKMGRAAKKPDDYFEWCNRFLKDHRARVHDELAPPVSAMMELTGNVASPGAMGVIVDGYLERLLPVLKAQDCDAARKRDGGWIVDQIGAK